MLMVSLSYVTQKVHFSMHTHTTQSCVFTQHIRKYVLWESLSPVCMWSHWRLWDIKRRRKRSRGRGRGAAEVLDS